MTEIEFMTYWEALCERHRVSPSAPLTRLYALTLKAEGVTADEWVTAVTASLRFDGFFPEIQRLIDHCRTSHKAAALTEWDACLQRARDGGPATPPGTETRRLMNSATNGTPLGNVSADQLPWVKKEFLERYAAWLAEEAKQRTPVLKLPHTSRRLTAPTKELAHAAD